MPGPRRPGSARGSARRHRRGGVAGRVGGAAVEDVLPGTAAQVVAARATEQSIGPGLAADRVLARTSDDDVVPVATDDRVRTATPVNCVRHAPGARVTRRARAQGGQVRVEVTDDGPGLPLDVADTVLRRGVRGPDSTGDGLGLAITNELVERHGGTFAVLSRTRGCTAVVQLPAAVRTVQPIGA